MVLTERFTLSNGVQIPKVGLGTWFIKDKDASGVVKNAVSLGYRLIDTASAYENESGVGIGVKESAIPREEIFVTSKIAAEVKSYDDAQKAIETALKLMGLDYLDMMLVHSPQPWMKWRSKKERYFDENKAVWKALEEAYATGKIKAIGVSNFLTDDLENLLSSCEVKPMVNQILNHIGNTPLDLMRFCHENGILVQSYSPIAHGRALKDNEIIAMAQKYGVSVSGLCIKFVIQQGTVALPKATSTEHLKDNIALDFEIAADDMRLLEQVKFKGYGMSKMFPVFSGK